MILTESIHRQIVAAIRREPRKALILPSFCYWKGRDQPVVYIDGLPENLTRVLYRELVGPLDFAQTLQLRPGVPARNINPYLFERRQHRRRGTVCPNGHAYAGNEMPSNSGRWRCRTCYLAWRARHRIGGKSVAVLNRAKTHCPKNHPYAGGNLIVLKSGRRRCRICHAADMARYRAAEKGIAA